jgi:hypothetical protein
MSQYNSQNITTSHLKNHNIVHEIPIPRSSGRKHKPYFPQTKAPHLMKKVRN